MTAPSVTGGLPGPAVVERVRIQVADRLTTDLRDYASKAGWPHYVVRNLSVIWTGSSWETDIPLTIRDAVHDLEYGTQTQQPNPAIRKFTAKMAFLADKASNAALVNLAGEVLR